MKLQEKGTYSPCQFCDNSVTRCEEHTTAC